MTDLRTAAQQALEAMRRAVPTGEITLVDWMKANHDLEAALAEPVQEPVAWIHTGPDKPRVKFLEWRENEPGYRGLWIKTPLYAAPPQRKPLTEEEIWRTYKNLWMFHPAEEPRLAGDVLKFARAIERAHGIKEST